MFSIIKKLRGRSLAELADRSRQMLLRRGERSGFFVSVPASVPTFAPDNLSIFFAPWKSDPDGFKHVFKARFPDTVSTIVKKADKILSGKFDLLGFGDLDFGKEVPDWHFDPTTGKHSPKKHWTEINEVSSVETGDKKVIWELNRHQYFTILGQAYLLTGDEKYAELFDLHLSDWLQHNPHKIGVNWLSSLELGFRAMSWIEAFYFFEDSHSFRQETHDEMARSLQLHARHIERYLSTYFSPNTHLTGEALALYIIGSFLGDGKEAKRWQKIGFNVLKKALDFQILSDGVYCEQSSHYARYTADFYILLMRLREHQGFERDPKTHSKIEALCEYLMFITDPNGETSLFGDEDGGKLFQYDDRELSDIRATLESAAVFFNRPDLKYVAGEASSQLLMLTGISGLEKYDAIDIEKPSAIAKAFHTSGSFTARSDWSENADHILIDCGPHGFMNAGHAHADVLSFTLTLAGIPVFVDSGTYVYTTDPSARDAFRSTSYHNCLTVNGEASSVTDGPFSWKSIANARLLEWNADKMGVNFRGSHDGFERFGVGYERSIEFPFDGDIKIGDTIRSKETVEIEVNFILSDKIKPTVSDRSVQLKDKANGRSIAEISADISDRRGSWIVVDHNVSPIYGKLIATKKLVFRITTDTDTDILFNIARSLKTGDV